MSYTFSVTATNAAGSGPAGSKSATVGLLFSPVSSNGLYFLPKMLQADSVVGAATGITRMVIGWDSTRAISLSNQKATATSKTVSWTAPAADATKAPIVGYVVERALSDSTYELVCVTSSTSCSATGLTNGATYAFRVTPFTGGALPVFIVMNTPDDWNATAAPASPSTTTTTSGTFTMAAPTGLMVFAGRTTATIAWVASSGSVAGQQYLVSDPTNSYSCLTSSTWCTISGLAAGVAVTFVVTPVLALTSGASTTYQVGTSSDSVSVTPSASGFDATVAIDPAHNLTGIRMTRWSADLATVLRAQLVLDSAATQLLSVEYIWWGATTAAGAWSLTPIAVPAQPNYVYVTSNSTTSVKITWPAPADNGSPITGYVVTASPGTATCSTTATSCVISGLTVGTSYVFTVVATNSLGSSLASQPTSRIVPQIPPITPKAPSPQTVTAVSGISSAFVSWTAPNLNYGASILRYEIRSVSQSRQSGQFYDSVTHTCITTALSCTITGLTNSLSYWFDVRAITHDDNATPSGEVGSTDVRSNQVKIGYLAVPDPQVPDAPGAVNVVSVPADPAAIATNSAVITWSAPDARGDVIIGYRVLPSTHSAAGTAVDVITEKPALACETTSTTCTIANLETSKSYTFAVMAINRVGRSTAATSVVIQAGVASGTAMTAPTNTVTFFGADPVKVSGSITCCTVSGSKLSVSGSLTTDSFSARVRTTELKNIVMTWRALATETEPAGWSGVADVVLGFGITVRVKVTAYAGPLDWTLTAVATNFEPGRNRRIAPGLSLPDFSFGGTLVAVGGTVTSTLSASMADLVFVTGVLKLRSIAVTLADSCPKLPSGTEYVCPTGTNGAFLILSGSLELTVAGKAYTASGLVVLGLTTFSLVMAAQLSDITIASGVKLTDTTVTYRLPSLMPDVDLLGVASAPSAPRSVTATTVLSDGTATVSWQAPENTGSSDVIGYKVTAMPVLDQKGDGVTASPDPVVCVSAPGNFTVTRQIIAEGSPYAKANPDRVGKATNITTINLFCAMSGLDPHTQYVYSVVAYNVVGEGSPGTSSTYGSLVLDPKIVENAGSILTISGGLSVTSLGLDIRVTVLNVRSATGAADGVSGWAVVATVSVDKAGSLRDAIHASGSLTVALLTLPGTVTLGGVQVEVPNTPTILIGASVDLDASVQKVLNGVQSLAGIVAYSPATGQFTVSLAMTTGWKTKVGSVTLTFMSTSIKMKGSLGSGGAVKLDSLEVVEVGSVSMPNGGSSISISASLGGRIDFSVGTAFTVGITLTPGTGADAVWPNMFAMKGFDLLAASFSVGFANGYPSLGISGTVRLPANMTKIMGGSAAAVVTVSANLSLSEFCIAIDVAAEDGVSNVVNIGNGALTASHVAFTFAPAGCTIGVGEQAATYPAGNLFSFTGSIMKTAVSVQISITYVGASVTLSGTATVGAITLGELKLDATTIELTLTDAPGGTEHFKFSGGATLFGVKLSVSASADYTLGTISGAVSVTASLSRMTVGGFGLEDVYLRFNLSTTSPQDFLIEFGAKVPLLPGVLVSGSGRISPTQVYVTVDNSIKWGTFSVTAKGTVYLGASNGSTTFSASVTMGISLLDQSLSGSLQISTDANGAHFSVTFPSLSYAPLGLVVFSLYADCTWSNFPGGAVIGGRISGGMNLGVISGSFSGAASFGTTSDGKPIFLVNVTLDVSLGISWIAEVSAKIQFTNCNSSCSSYASPVLKLWASTTWQGNTIDTGWNTISLDGTFSISASASFEKWSGIAYGCSKCEDPGSAGLLRWQAYFKGSASFTFSSAGSLSTNISASAEIQQGASKGTCTHKTIGICDKTDYSWGSFTKLIGVSIKIDSDGRLKSSYAGRDYGA